ARRLALALILPTGRSCLALPWGRLIRSVLFSVPMLLRCSLAPLTDTGADNVGIIVGPDPLLGIGCLLLPDRALYAVAVGIGLGGEGTEIGILTRTGGHSAQELVVLVAFGDIGAFAH